MSVHQLVALPGETITIYGPVHALRLVPQGDGVGLRIDRGPRAAITLGMSYGWPAGASPDRVEVEGGAAGAIVEWSPVPGVVLLSPAVVRVGAGDRGFPAVPIARRPYIIDGPKGDPIAVDAGRYLLVVTGGTVRVGGAGAAEMECTPLVDGTQLVIDAEGPLTAYGAGTLALLRMDV